LSSPTGDTYSTVMEPFGITHPIPLSFNASVFLLHFGMHQLGLYTLCVFYILLSHVAARPFPASILAPPSNATLAILAASTVVTISPSLTANAVTTSHTGTHKPLASTHTSRTSFSQPSGTPTSSPYRSAQTHHPLPASAIVGVVFGALAGLVFVLSVARCWCSWKKTPPPDRIQSLVTRYELEREMQAAMVAPLTAYVRPPPPPYRPPPPRYESVKPSPPPPAHL